jgi:SAM-dependent methyltransferase
MNSNRVTDRDVAPPRDGAQGWDDYAAFYDWENARTVGRRDVKFWRDFSRTAAGVVLELGCGTGRIALPLARSGVRLVGVDRSAEMLAFARRRLRRAGLLAQSRATRPVANAPADRRIPPLAPRRAPTSTQPGRASLVRGDIRALPFPNGSFDAVIAPYGILQSLLRDEDLDATLAAVGSVLASDGRFGIDLVPDVPRWKEYRRRVSLVGRKGRKGPLVTLVESVRQDRNHRLTIFDHEYIVGWGRQRDVRSFTVTFRTLPVPALISRVETAGFVVDATLGGYDGRPLNDRSDAWIILARKK